MTVSDEEAQKQNLLPATDHPNTIEFYNSRSRVFHDDEEDKIVFYFDYKKEGNDQEEIINWQKLKELKDKKRWGVIRHPLVLNFVNERLLDCAGFYTFHMLTYFSFLLILSSHVFSRTRFKDWLITGYLALFLFFMLIKGAIKVQISTGVSCWFAIAYAFNFLTYAATFAYVWLPTVFKYDDYHPEVKSIILWFLPIVAIISAWVNFLYILRKSPYGIYIFMMVRILRSFGHIATIWIPTLIAFSFAFHLIMRDSGIEPWMSVEQDTNSTMIHKLFIILQAITKTSTMMIGEVDANDILGTKQWIPSILVLAFEIITVILLMNLMVSLAVGDVSDLRNSAQDKLLKIKVSFVIEALQLSQALPSTLPDRWLLYKKKTKNVLVVDRDENYFTVMRSKNDFRTKTGESRSPTRTPAAVRDQVYRMSFTNPRMRVRVQKQHLVGRHQMVHLEDCQIVFTESPDSGIPRWEEEPTNPSDQDNWTRKYAKWLIGLDWIGYLDL
ncbi:unnamed protein product, partial [Mesorhabditis belari]|uniref:Ion transport domain-containing protein n=1 Tax=Mesorhabditis belari TaxID=2138241 RepID=A0AAF3J5F6_9BILA